MLEYVKIRTFNIYLRTVLFLLKRSGLIQINIKSTTYLASI